MLLLLNMGFEVNPRSLLCWGEGSKGVNPWWGGMYDLGLGMGCVSGGMQIVKDFPVVSAVCFVLDGRKSWKWGWRWSHCFWWCFVNSMVWN